jgi:hypothetical protein
MIKHFKAIPRRPQFAIDLSRIAFINEGHDDPNEHGHITVLISYLGAADFIQLSVPLTSEELDGLMEDYKLSHYAAEAISRAGL